MTAFIQKAVIKGTLLNTVQIRNVFYAQVDPTFDETFQVLWTEYLNGIYNEVRQILTTAFALTDYEVYQWFENEWVLMDDVAYVKGGATSDPLVPNLVAAVLVGKVQQYRGFGRKFFSGLGTGSMGVNALTATALSIMASAALAYVSPVIMTHGGTLGPGIWTKAHQFRAFSSGFVSSLLGTMRRRKPGLGI